MAGRILLSVAIAAFFDFAESRSMFARGAGVGKNV
eukprot:CAMPEP_0176215854 /NCGR_PEP_ID=MMETSP0121_2-20121125/16894_1 /TAXON_ID=160619 /ORGANISM="Kryptoperidinium foliaceum, Strain CCMP 1326" /LENGTH=34 /DNA_ID= /DNA_START= /DNA_END= /DNA_ORIENTATION=